MTLNKNFKQEKTQEQDLEQTLLAGKDLTINFTGSV